MSTSPIQPLPTSRQLVKATALAVGIAGILLVTVILPAEFDLDPTGVGARLGLDVLNPTEDDAAVVAPVVPTPAVGLSQDQQARNVAETTNAQQTFGANAKQSFAAEAFWSATTVPKQESLTVTLAPGKGAEVKTLLKAGEGMVFHWKATGDVALDMHGERVGVKGAWTSYSVQAAQNEAAGTFIAPFDGSHGWYWENRSQSPVTVEIQVNGFQEALYQP